MDLKSQISIVLVEDDEDLRDAIMQTLEKNQFVVSAFSNVPSAWGFIESNADNIHLILSDVNMEGETGYDLLAKVQSHTPQIPFILMTAFGSVGSAVEAMKNGATDYIQKPFSIHDMVQKVKSAHLKAFDDAPVGESDVFKLLTNVASKVAQTDSTVLLVGESGTGKEVISRFVHNQSNRASKPFIALNCAAIPENMLEAMLFGYEKGAFTGAVQSMPGKFEQANGGTLLLDEISEMDLALQAKLLRVIQEREVERLGGKKTIALDVRIIATTNRDLESEVTEGRFREDLFYRLSVFPIVLPPLRDRGQDVALLAKSIVDKQQGSASVELSDEAILKLESYDWPGNVRELDNVMQRAIILSNGKSIEASDIMLTSISSQLNTQKQEAKVNNVVKSNQVDSSLDSDDFQDNLIQTEFNLILKKLVENNGSKKLTAEAIGVSDRTLRYKMARFRDLGLDIDQSFKEQLAKVES